MNRLTVVRSLCGITTALIVCAPVEAGFNSNAPLFTVVSTAGSATANDTSTLLAPGVYAHTGSWTVANASINWDFNVFGWSDATQSGFLNSNIVVKNNTATAQTFTFTVAMPGEANGPIRFGGSIGGQFVNGSGSLGQLTSSGPLWSAIIDGAPASTQLNNALFFVQPFAVQSLGSFNFSNQLLSGAITSAAAIKFSFTMSAGGEASFTSNFNFQQVPAPGALALIGFVPLTTARRRRK
jgi:hypothetical protein